MAISSCNIVMSTVNEGKLTIGFNFKSKVNAC
jgi:hypothetical protein